MSSPRREIEVLRMEFEQTIEIHVQTVEFNISSVPPAIDLSKDNVADQIEVAKKVLSKNITDRNHFMKEQERKSIDFRNRVKTAICSFQHAHSKYQEVKEFNERLGQENDNIRHQNAQLQRELAALKLRLARDEANASHEASLVEREQQKVAELTRECREKDRMLAQLKYHLK